MYHLYHLYHLCLLYHYVSSCIKRELFMMLSDYCTYLDLYSTRFSAFSRVFFLFPPPGLVTRSIFLSRRLSAILIPAYEVTGKRELEEHLQ